MPDAMSNLTATIDFSPCLTGLLASSRLTGGRHEAILVQWAKGVHAFVPLSCHFFLTPLQLND